MRVLSIGPESTGSRLAAKTAAFLLGINKWNRWDADRQETITNEFHSVTHLSWPYGRRTNFPSLTRYKDHKIIITIRDKTASLKSVLNSHDRNKRNARDGQAIALKLAEEALMNESLDTFLLPYESMVAVQPAIIFRLSKWLGVSPPEYIPERIQARDENKKWY